MDSSCVVRAHLVWLCVDHGDSARPQKIGGWSLKVQQKKTSPSQIGILRPGFQKPWARQEFGPTQQKSRGLDPDNSEKQLVTWRIENKKGPKVSCPLAAIIWSVYNDLGQAQKGVDLSGRWGKATSPKKGEVRAEIKTLPRVEQEGQVMDHRSNQDTSTCPAFKLLLYKPVAFSKTTKKLLFCMNSHRILCFSPVVGNVFNPMWA